MNSNTIHRLLAYSEHKKRAVILREEIAFAGVKTTAGYSLAPGGSGTSDSTGQLACRIGDKMNELRNIEHEIKIIDMALNTLSAPKRLIIETRFMTEYIQDKEAYISLKNQSRRHKWKVMRYDKYERLRDEALEQVAYLLGDTESITIR